MGAFLENRCQVMRELVSELPESIPQEILSRYLSGQYCPLGAERALNFIGASALQFYGCSCRPESVGSNRHRLQHSRFESRDILSIRSRGHDITRNLLPFHWFGVAVPRIRTPEKCSWNTAMRQLHRECCDILLQRLFARQEFGDIPAQVEAEYRAGVDQLAGATAHNGYCQFEPCTARLTA
jgi:hypothetical protein